MQSKMNKHIDKFLKEIQEKFENNDEFDIYVPLAKFEVGQIFGKVFDCVTFLEFQNTFIYRHIT